MKPISLAILLAILCGCSHDPRPEPKIHESELRNSLKEILARAKLLAVETNRSVSNVASLQLALSQQVGQVHQPAELFFNPNWREWQGQSESQDPAIVVVLDSGQEYLFISFDWTLGKSSKAPAQWIGDKIKTP